MTTTINVPSLGESVAEAEVGKWLVKVGQKVDKDEPLVEIMTDKADSPVFAPEAGVVTQIFASEGDLVAVGDKLCEVDAKAKASAAATPASAQASTEETPSSSDGAGDPVASPAVRKLAREHDVDLTGVDGSGQGGRITKDDVLGAERSSGPTTRDFVRPPSAPKPAGGQAGAVTLSTTQGPKGAFRLPPYREKPGDEVIPFSRRRRIIADHMVFSKLTSPHVVTFAECDLHRTARLRDQHKREFKAAGFSLSYLSFVCAAVVRALSEFPEINARVLDDSYVKLRDINLGIAVDTPEGLVVPVIRNADERSIRGIARGITDLATKARDGKLVPDDLANKTFTISNPGRKGNLVGGAIISQPNVGILRIGEIKKRVVVVEGEDGDTMAIHPVMYMALSYDHRIVDGVHANGFLWRINEILETADFEL